MQVSLILLHYSEAVKLVSAVANHINEHIKQQDNFMKMLAIQKSISGPAGLQILIPGRVFIKEGMLHKVCANKLPMLAISLNMLLLVDG